GVDQLGRPRLADGNSDGRQDDQRGERDRADPWMLHVSLLVLESRTPWGDGLPSSTGCSLVKATPLARNVTRVGPPAVAEPPRPSPRSRESPWRPRPRPTEPRRRRRSRRQFGIWPSG